MCSRQKTAYTALSTYVSKADFRGWDVFDGLNSKLFRATPFYRSRLLRLVWIQFFKRSFINLRSLAAVPTGYNAKGLGLFASGLFMQGRLEDGEALLEKLQEMVCADYPGSSWGYNFDWEARAFYVPQGKPNIVTTVFVANAFLDHYDLTADAESLRLAEGACEFILQSLILYEDDSSICFGYIPGEDARVHNANMLGAALLGRVYAIIGNSLYLDKSRKSMGYSVAALREDHSWPYGERSHHQFVDNFHTGFNLVALKEWMESTGEKHWQGQLEGAYHYFLENFWLENGCPKYYHNSLYPIDIHCSAQGIVTCLKLKDLDPASLSFAEKISRWAINNMQDDKEGYFYYQKKHFFTNKIPYIRWSQAWMFYALSMLLKEDTFPEESSITRINVLNCSMDVATMGETVDIIADRIENKQFTQHVVVNVAKLVNMQHDTALKESVEACDIINIDGMGVVLGARLLGHDVPERVAGVDLFHQLLQMGAERGFPVFLLGAEEEVVAEARRRVEELYPGLIVAGHHHGYFWDDEQAVVDEISQSGARLLFVAITSPKKENFINRWQNQLGVDFVMGVGGTFDVVAGKVKRAPLWMQKYGLEWLYRVIQEPRRMWKRYLVTNSKFALLLLKEKFGLA